MVWPIIEVTSSDECYHKIRRERYVSLRKRGWISCEEIEETVCGHPAATGAPCMYWSCPIAVYEAVDKEEAQP
jgi:hypothetical protein